MELPTDVCGALYQIFKNKAQKKNFLYSVDEQKSIIVINIIQVQSQEHVRKLWIY